MNVAIKTMVFGVQPLDQAHDCVSSFAAAYSLGEKESAAAVNLLKYIPANIKEQITELVRFLEKMCYQTPSPSNIIHCLVIRS